MPKELVKLRDQYIQENAGGSSLHPSSALSKPISPLALPPSSLPPVPASPSSLSSVSATAGNSSACDLTGTSPGTVSLDAVFLDHRRPRDITFSVTSSTFSTSHTSSEDLTPPSPGVPDLDEDAGSNQSLTGRQGQDSLDPHGMRTMSDLQIEPTAKVEDLLAMFKETESLEEQGDILHYLSYTKGIMFDTKLGPEGHSLITVKDLLKDLYEKACQERRWALVRHIAGILGKKVEDLAKAITDILVRQKQVTIGMPPASEHTITRPLPSKELRQIINKAHGGDQSTAMLTQELLVFLAMFIRTEPQLFSEMLRLRVGLIIQVMASELGRALKCSGQEASEHLLNLSPYEMKMLLHHILSGKEFGVKGGMTLFISSSDSSPYSSFSYTLRFPCDFFLNIYLFITVITVNRKKRKYRSRENIVMHCIKNQHDVSCTQNDILRT